MHLFDKRWIVGRLFIGLSNECAATGLREPLTLCIAWRYSDHAAFTILKQWSF